MDPFNMPSINAPVNYQADLQNVVGQVAPLATSYHGAQNGVNIGQAFPTASTPAQPSVVSKFAHFIGGVGSEIGHIGAGAATWLGKNTLQAVTSPYHYAQGINHAILDNKDVDMIQAQTQHNSDALDSLFQTYKSGRITAAQYQAGLKTLGKDNNSLVDQSSALDQRISSDKGQAIKATIDVASLLTTILTAGFGKAAVTTISGAGLAAQDVKTASEYLTSKAAGAYLGDAEGAISKVASNPEVFKNLPEAAQLALQKSTAEVIAQNGGNMTAGQIGRAAATNLALKYPIYYNALSSTGQQIYQELDQQKYGSAMRTLAFNAALLLSGGPIGQALKFGGAVGKSTVGAIFGRSSFIDELSKGIGDGSPDGLFNAINGIKDPALRKEVIENMSHLEATNLNAVDGKDPVAAAWRVLNGMNNYEGVSMNQFTHEQALDNMVSFAKAQKLADDTAKSLGLPGVTVGRVDAGTLNRISSQLSPIGNVEDRLNAWDALKGENPNAAWANNENFDRQVKSLIQTHESPASLDSALRGINASSKIEGFPSSVEKSLAKMGYIPITPKNLEAPFKEGSGELSSKFSGDTSEFFNKVVQPLPVLSSLGSLLTNLGLSPQASGARVYQLFNGNLSENIQKLDVLGLGEFKGADGSQTADNIIKTLSNYAKQPTRGGLEVNGAHVRPPITDLRQLTTKDVQAALGVTAHDARQVKGAVMDAMLQVPLTVRGLGDKIADINYKINPASKSFARVQGAARFAWNPIFRAKLAYKTEILSQAVAGGKVPTLAGTNTILSTVFPEYYNKLDSIRETLRDAGVFEKKGAGSIVGGEAVSDGSAVGANLTHKLLPAQERSIASMVATQADKVNLSTDDFIKNYPEEVRNTVQSIAQYDRNASFLNSPLARTLNFAFFPFRFETKVATIMAQSLAKTDPLTQFAVVKGVYNMSNFLKSPEGMAWYSKNSDVIGLMKYFTPLSTLSTVAQVLGTGGTSIGAYGELGGLPFGWIPQALDAEGITHFGVGYVDAKSGNSIPSYVPTTDKGQLATAIQDLIGALFTYPGATVGLPSKSKIDQNIAMGLTTAQKTKDFHKVQNPISPQQQNYQDTIQSLSNTSLQSATTANPGEPTQSTQGVNVPQQSSPLLSPLPRSTKASGSGTAKKKKGEFTPQLLPGQTQLGG